MKYDFCTVEQDMIYEASSMEAKGFRLSRSKTEYMKCDFSTTTQEEDVRLDGQMVRYLGLMLQKDEGIDEDVR
jgi:hypothetical protein